MRRVDDLYLVFRGRCANWEDVALDLMTRANKRKIDIDGWLIRAIVAVFALTAILVLFDHIRPIRHGPTSMATVLSCGLSVVMAKRELRTTL